MILAPLAAITYSKLRLALFLRGRRIAAPVARAHARRGGASGTRPIAVAAMLAAAAVAWSLHPPRPF